MRMQSPCPECGFLLLDGDEPLEHCPGCGVPWSPAARREALLAGVLGATTSAAASQNVPAGSQPGSFGRIGFAIGLALATTVWLYEAVVVPRRVHDFEQSQRQAAIAEGRAQAEQEQLQLAAETAALRAAHNAALSQRRSADQALAVVQSRLLDLERTHAEALEMLRTAQAERDQLAADLAAAESELAVALSAQAGSFLRHWQLLGPLPGIERTLQDEVEKKEFRSSFKTAGLRDSVRWTPYDSPEDRLSFNQALQCSERAHAYAMTWVYVPDRQRIQLSVGSDDGCLVWLNRELVLERRGARSAAAGQDRVPAQLVAGWNELLACVDNSGGNDWALYVEFRSEDGAQPLRISQSPTPPKTTRRR